MAPLSSYKLEMRFDDVDHFTETVRDWDLDFWQLERGRFSGELSQLAVGGVQLGKAKFNRKLHQFGLSPTGGWTFVIPGQNDLNLLWRGHQLSANELMCFPLDRGLESISDSNFDVHTVTIPEGYLERKADQMELRSATSLLRGNEICAVDPRLLLALRMQLDRMHGLSAACLSSQAETLQAELDISVGYIIQSWSAAVGDKQRGVPRPRRRMLAEVRQYIDQHERTPIRISDLCQHVGVSERTIQYAFQAEYQCTPKQYLNARRLHGVRKEIRENPMRSIAEAASAWGFWHMGQFAADYRRMFGESPSRTLR